MKIETPLHAEHQLDQLAGQFAHWRQTRPHPHSQIPPELWAHAVALTAVVPPSRVAKQLRLRLADLKKQIATRHAAPTAMPPTSLGFVEVPLPPMRPQTSATTQIELQRADGTRLCIHVPTETLPLETLVLPPPPVAPALRWTYRPKPALHPSRHQTPASPKNAVHKSTHLSQKILCTKVHTSPEDAPTNMGTCLLDPVFSE